MRIRNQRLTVILVPQGGARTYSFQARLDLLVAACSIVLLFLLITVTLMFTYGRYFHASRQTARLQSEVDKLRHELRQVDDLRNELAENEDTRRKVLSMLARGTGAPDTFATATASMMPGGESSEMQEREADFSRSVPRSWPVRGPVTKEFLAGNRDARGFHPGIDIAAPTGALVRAAAAGTVTFAGWDPEYGYLVILDHGMGLETRYGHNSRLTVGVGDRVERGQPIAGVGSTGRSSAPHLHLEIRKDGIAMDPRQYLE